jgi:probable rRNA maturation factor
VTPRARAAVVEVVVRAGVPGLLTRDRCREIVEAAVSAAGAPSGATVSLTLSDDLELTALNGEHMGKAGPTDVLSFPLLPPSAFPEHPGQDRSQRGDAETFPLPPGEALHLGDIVVSVERAIEQAEGGAGGQANDRRWSPSDELRLLITHGALHLCGWDHADETEGAAMRALERRLLGFDGEDPGTPVGSPALTGAVEDAG